MKRAFVLSYDGSAFHGWQRQKSLPTVQEALERAVFALCGKEVYVSGCGRTDAGVHAAYYVASCEDGFSIPDEKLPFALNAHLPPSVVVRRSLTVSDEFDARFSCKKKEYTYIIDNGAFPDPLKLGYASYVKRRLDTERMAAGAAYLLGEHDFSAFRCEGSNVKTTVRTLYTCEVARDGDAVRIKASADGFLYNMVRNIAGTLIYVGLSKFEPRDAERILLSCDRKEAGPCAPPQGLYMTALYYGTEGLDGGKSV